MMPLAGLLMDTRSEYYDSSLRMVCSITEKEDIKTVFVIVNGGSQYVSEEYNKNVPVNETPEEVFRLSLQMIVDMFTAGKKVFLVSATLFYPRTYVCVWIAISERKGSGLKKDGRPASAKTVYAGSGKNT